eukprot:scaffold24653_cov157-Cylindrotheca_fusiformis.AAC.4
MNIVGTVVLLSYILGVTSGFSVKAPLGLPNQAITKEESTIGGTTSHDDHVLLDRRQLLWKSLIVTFCTTTTAQIVAAQPASARLESVNRPELLPSERGLHVIQIEKFITTGQARRMDQLLASLEADTGYRVYLLCQSYPNTPGLAIRDYWDLGKEGQKDDKYVVLVVDEFGGRDHRLIYLLLLQNNNNNNLFSLNGAPSYIYYSIQRYVIPRALSNDEIMSLRFLIGVKLALPNIFWTRLSGKYGTTFYVRENGIDLSITNALEAISSCLRSKEGYCTSPPEEAESLQGLGFF